MLLAAFALALVKALKIPVAILSFLTSGIWPKHTDLEGSLSNHKSYDFIIVGGGTAGCVMATRLAQNKSYTVLLLEAGGDPPISALLARLYVLLPNSKVDYNYKSTHDPYAAGSQNNYTKLIAGKMLGGSASLNHFIAMRGTRNDYDSWKSSDNSGWGYDDILPYFRKLESVKDSEILDAYPEYHGTSGPIGITNPKSSDITKYLKAFASVNNPTILDHNSNVSIGYAHALYTIANNLRQTPAYSYLNLVKDHDNLKISKDTLVTKIVFKDKKATGVEAMFDGKKYKLKAKKEVILCAGVFNSPQLLMLSGIGPKDHLKKINIPVLADLPVGDNLQDHVAIQLVHKMETSFIPSVSLPTVTKIPFPVFVGSLALNKSATSQDYQTFNLVFPHGHTHLILTCSVVFGIKDEICKRLKKQTTFRNVLYTFLTHVQPKSRGKVRLASDDAKDAPLITTGFYTQAKDLEDMVDFVIDFLKVQDSKYFKKVCAELAGLDLPECKAHKQGTREFWKCYVLNHSVSLYHGTSTCAMGKVVDHNLMVKGVKNLRVVDASVLPNIPRSAPMLTVVMVAEKGAVLVLNSTSK